MPQGNLPKPNIPLGKWIGRIAIGSIIATFLTFLTLLPEAKRCDFSKSLGSELFCPYPTATFILSPTLTPTPTSTPTQTPIPSSAILYQENFESGRADGWIHQWGDSLQVKMGIGENLVFGGAGTGEMILSPGYEWQNYALTLKFRVSDWGFGDTNFHVAVRRQREQGCNRYFVYLHRERTEIHVGGGDCKDILITGKNSRSILTNQWHKLYIAVQGSDITWQIDDEPMQAVNDTTYLQGTISIYIGDVGEIEFDDILVWTP